MPTPRPERFGSGPSFARTLIWVVVVFDLLIVGLGAWTLQRSHGQYVERAEMATQNLAQVLEQNILGMVNQVDLVLLTVKDEIERKGGQPLDDRLEASIQAQFSRVGILDGLRSTDEQGIINHGTGVTPSRPIGVRDRGYFQQLKAHPEAGLVISPPLIGRHSGKWVILLARRLNHPDGSFAGIVLGTLTLESLGQTFSRVDVGRLGSISLRGANLELLERFPKSPGGDRFIGDTKIEGDYLKAVQSGSTVSHFTTHSRIDGQARTYTFRKVTQPVFYILVGLAQGEYLQAWRREAFLSGFAVLGLLALSVGIVWMARSAWGRQLKGQAERDQLIGDLTRALTEVKNLKGLLPICGQCKKIRDDQGYWSQIESYISEHSEATFTHGVCPDCSTEIRREMLARREQKILD
jgi:hypothetical protein